MAYQKSSTFYWRRKKIGKEIKKIDSLEIILTKINNTCEIYNLFQVEIQTQKKILLPLLSPSFSNTKAKQKTSSSKTYSKRVKRRQYQ